MPPSTITYLQAIAASLAAILVPQCHSQRFQHNNKYNQHRRHHPQQHVQQQLKFGQPRLVGVQGPNNAVSLFKSMFNMQQRKRQGSSLGIKLLRQQQQPGKRQAINLIQRGRGNNGRGRFRIGRGTPRPAPKPQANPPRKPAGGLGPNPYVQHSNQPPPPPPVKVAPSTTSTTTPAPSTTTGPKFYYKPLPSSDPPRPPVSPEQTLYRETNIYSQSNQQPEEEGGNSVDEIGKIIFFSKTIFWRESIPRKN